MTDLVKIEQSSTGIATLTLNRPEKRNALNIPMLKAITEAIDKIHADPKSRVIILQGAGPVFCAGLDLQELTNPGLAEESTQALFNGLLKLSSSPLVTIAAAHGCAIAGGAGFVSICDIAIAASGTKIGYPEVRRGLVGALIMPFLQRQLSDHHVREILLLGELLDAERAAEIGLLNAVFPQEQLLSQAKVMAQSALKGGPKSIAETKRMLDELNPKTMENFKKAYRYHRDMRISEEAAEGAKAFVEKRAPAWEV